MLTGISLDQLQIFIAAVDEGSFSAAARRLKRVQSLVSQTVSHLEGQLGVRLFDRTARYPVLTDQGRTVLADARTVTRQMDLLKARAKGLASEGEAELSVVVDLLFPVAMLAETMTALQKQFPETQLRLSLEELGAIDQHVLDRRSVVGVTASLMPSSPQVARERLMTVQWVMVVSFQHPLASHRRPIPTEIFTDYIQAIDIENYKLPPNHRSSVLSPKTWLVAHPWAKIAFLRTGLGFGFVPLHMIDEDLASGALVQITPEVFPFSSYAVDVSALYRNDNPPGPAGRWLINRLMQADGQQLGASARDSLHAAIEHKSSSSRPMARKTSRSRPASSRRVTK